MTRARWSTPRTLNRGQVVELRRLLGPAAARYIEGANDALEWHAQSRAEAGETPTPGEINARLDAVVKAAQRLALALHTLGDDAGGLLEETAQRRRKVLPDERAVVALAMCAGAARLPTRRGAPIEGAKLLLVRQLAEHYHAATGKRPAPRGERFAAAVVPVLEAARERTNDTSRLIRAALKR